MEQLNDLPDDLVQAIRTVAIPLSVRAALGRMPRPLSLEVSLPRDLEALPTPACQWLKLSISSPGLRLQRLTRSPKGSTPELRLGFGPRQIRWDAHRPLHEGIWVALWTLLPEGVEHLIDTLAFSDAVHDTLQTITNHMLRTDDLEVAFSLMLSGLTSGYGLGFNRAALLVWQPEQERFHGERAIGPVNQAQAKQIWEQLEREDAAIDALISDYDRRSFDSPFQELVRQIQLAPREPLVQEALLSAHATCASARQPLGGLEALDIDSPFVLARVGAPERPLGLIFADNRYNHAAISPQQLRHLAFFLDQTALIWESLRLRKLMWHQAHHDALTGALNRRAFDLELTQRLQADQPFWLVLLDVDEFKQVNDRMGHAEGDRRLRAVSQELRLAFGDDILVARLGGDEFALLMPPSPKRLMEGLGALSVAMSAQQISLSLGAAQHPSEAQDAEALLALADARLYAAKRAGRSCAVLGEGQLIRLGELSEPTL